MELVKVKETRLTDGSLVFDVVNIRRNETEGKVIISADSEHAAIYIADAINKHAVDVYGATGRDY